MKSGRFSLAGRIRARTNVYRCPRGPKESVKHSLLPPGIHFGFNHDDRELGWVLAGEDRGNFGRFDACEARFTERVRALGRRRSALASHS